MKGYSTAALNSSTELFDLICQIIKIFLNFLQEIVSILASYCKENFFVSFFSFNVGGNIYVNKREVFC